MRLYRFNEHIKEAVSLEVRVASIRHRTPAQAVLLGVLVVQYGEQPHRSAELLHLFLLQHKQVHRQNPPIYAGPNGRLTRVIANLNSLRFVLVLNIKSRYQDGTTVENWPLGRCLLQRLTVPGPPADKIYNSVMTLNIKQEPKMQHLTKHITLRRALREPPVHMEQPRVLIRVGRIRLKQIRLTRRKRKAIVHLPHKSRRMRPVSTTRRTQRRARLDRTLDMKIIRDSPSRRVNIHMDVHIETRKQRPCR